MLLRTPDKNKCLQIMLWTVVVAGTGGCATAGLEPRPSKVPAGYVELDENTDPRFVHHGERSPIGQLYPRGRDVYLNRERVTRIVDMPNNAHVRTGRRSFARIRFKPGVPSACHVGIFDFRTGGLRGGTDRCRHSIETAHAGGESTRPTTEYHVEVDREATIIRLVSGTFVAWPRDDPRQRRTIGRGQQVTVTPSAIRGPTPIDRRRRIEPDRLRRQIEQPPIPPGIDVPNLQNGTVGAAKAILGKLGLRAYVAQPNAGDDWLVVRQHPAAGARLNEGGAVTIEARVPTVRVPNLARQSVARARAILESRGLRTIVYPGNARSNWWVYRQRPSAGRMVRKGSAVTIEVQAPIH